MAKEKTKGSSEGKNPTVNWFFNDWHGGTSIFTRHQKGCYMDLLHAQFNNGHLSLESIKTVLGSDFGLVWPTLQKKFETNKDGFFFNKRLDNEIKNKAAYSESRSKNKKGKTKSYDNHMGYGLGNELGNVFNFKSSLVDFGFFENLISDWLIIRKNKKATNTETAFKGFVSEILKSGMDKNEALKICVERSWSGFKAEWMNDKKNQITKSATKVENILSVSEKLNLPE